MRGFVLNILGMSYFLEGVVRYIAARIPQRPAYNANHRDILVELKHNLTTNHQTRLIFQNALRLC